jgi:hypothetical protein
MCIDVLPRVGIGKADLGALGGLLVVFLDD